MANYDLVCYARKTLLFLLIIPLAYAQPGSFECSKFTSYTDLKQLKLEVEGDACVSDSGIQLTKNDVDPNSNWTGSVGRVISSQPIHLWNKTSNRPNDFATHFSFSIISSNQSSHGDGLTFFLASQNLTNVNGTTGLGAGGIGIGRVDNKTSLPTEYQFFAVEFDTFSNQWDPRGAHVGVNINSMKSDILEEWLLGNSEMNTVYDCSIQYNSADYYLTLSLTRSGFNEGPTTQYLSYHINLCDHLPDYVIVGISAATGDFSEEHTLLSWSFSTSLPSKDHHKKDSKLLLEGIGTGAGFSMSLIGLVYVLLWTRNKIIEPPHETTFDLDMDDEFQMNIGPKKISYGELVSATNNFEETQKLRQGAFGCVYKGYLKESNSFASIKKITADSTWGAKEYEAEVKIISQLRHKNLVKLSGWCHKKNELLLIYEYMPNGSLDSRLFQGENFLSWQVRYNIALGLASALLYLQEEWETCVIHRDIKSSNIMLDSNFNAKLGGFGLAMLVDHEKVTQTTGMGGAGTMRYLGPEHKNTDKARKEYDIFSFGVVLLEVVSGTKAILHHDLQEGKASLVEWVWKLYRTKNLLAAADPKLGGVFDAQQMECLLVVGLWCANPYCTSSPSIRQVIKVLNFEVPLPILHKIPELANQSPSTPTTD